MFIATSLPVGGAERLLAELVHRMDRQRYLPEICCLKDFDRVGESLATDVPAFSGLLAHKFDVSVLWRLTRLLRHRRIDAVVTIGCGDKMFWGRLAGRLAGVPVICSALHSTGLPDHVELPNRLLAPWTDAFIAVAESHGCYLAAKEGCPAAKIHVIRNGVDTDRFHPRWPDSRLQREFDLEPDGPVAGVVAALRPEKNHDMFLRVAAAVQTALPAARWLIVGDGPERKRLESLSQALGVSQAVRFLGTRHDIPEVLGLMDVVLLCSRMEASPICLMEAMAAEKPVVATRVGSVPELLGSGRNGCLVAADDSAGMAAMVLELLRDRDRAAALGRAGREFVLAHGSVARMVDGYQDLIAAVYEAKCRLSTPLEPAQQVADHVLFE